MKKKIYYCKYRQYAGMDLERHGDASTKMLQLDERENIHVVLASSNDRFLDNFLGHFDRLPRDRDRLKKLGIMVIEDQNSIPEIHWKEKKKIKQKKSIPSSVVPVAASA